MALLIAIRRRGASRKETDFREAPVKIIRLKEGGSFCYCVYALRMWEWFEKLGSVKDDTSLYKGIFPRLVYICAGKLYLVKGCWNPKKSWGSRAFFKEN